MLPCDLSSTPSSTLSCVHQVMDELQDIVAALHPEQRQGAMRARALQLSLEIQVLTKTYQDLTTAQQSQEQQQVHYSSSHTPIFMSSLIRLFDSAGRSQELPRTDREASRRVVVSGSTTRCNSLRTLNAIRCRGRIRIRDALAGR